MPRKILIAFVCLMMTGVSLGATPPPDDVTDGLLRSAEALFQTMQAREYQRLWALLSRKSQQTIVRDTWNELKKKSGSYTEDRVRQDFAAGEGVAQAYWKAFLEHFDPVMVLEQSTWEMGEVKGDQAVIKLTYRKADRPAMMKMYREDGAWKVGLTESFWTSKVRKMTMPE